MKLGLSLLFAATFASTAVAQDLTFVEPEERDARIAEALEALANEPDPADAFRWYGEVLYYDMEVWGSEAARCALQTGYPELNPEHGWVVPVLGLATSTGLFNAMFPMRDSGTALLDPVTMLPDWAEKILDERGVARSYQVTFERDDYYSPVVRDRDGQIREYSRWLPAETHDAFSWIQTMRGLDLDVGTVHVHYVYDGWKLSRMTSTVTAHTGIYTELGMIEAAEFSLTREVLHSDQALPYANDVTEMPPVFEVTDGPVHLGRGWISLDDRRLPVGVEIEAPAPLGAIRVMLTNYDAPNASYTPDPAIFEATE